MLRIALSALARPAVAILRILLICSCAGLAIGVDSQRAAAGAGGLACGGDPSNPCPCWGGLSFVGLPGNFKVGSPGTARSFHTSTTIFAPSGPANPFLDGLVAGGEDANGQVTDTADVFDSCAQFSSANIGSMTTPRALHQATLLGEHEPGFAAQVLIVGGSRDLTPGRRASSALSSAEVFNFSTVYSIISEGRGGVGPPFALVENFSGNFAAVGRMNKSRTLHQATLLQNGKVLITGGVNSAGKVLKSAELYDPSAGVFTLTKGAMHRPRYAHTSTLLPDGSVLIAGGLKAMRGDAEIKASKSVLKSAEIYDPVSDKFMPVPQMKFARAGHTASQLTGQNAILMAGGITPKGVTASAELYTPAPNGHGPGSFTLVGDMTIPRFLHTASQTFGGQILIVGGTSNGKSLTPLNTAELFDPGTKRFTATGTLNVARRNQSAGDQSAAGGGLGVVVVTGGSDAAGNSLGSTEIYLPPWR
jgi:hypothetical protein